MFLIPERGSGGGWFPPSPKKAELPRVENRDIGYLLLFVVLTVFFFTIAMVPNHNPFAPIAGCLSALSMVGVGLRMYMILEIFDLREKIRINARRL